jgi:hypothetical protein
MKKLLFACLIGVTFLSGCDSGNNEENDLLITGYSKNTGGNASQSISAIASKSISDGTYHSSDYRSFPIDNHGEKPVTDRGVTVDAILQFERDVPGYNDDPAGYVGYLENHSSYPSDARSTGNEGVYLVFDSRNPLERYQVGYHHINLKIAESNLEYFENLIVAGNPISIFHINAGRLDSSPTTCWVISWVSETKGGVVGSPF